MSCNTNILIASAFFTAAALGSHTGRAQDLLLTNGRVIVGTGQVIEHGFVAVRGGHIAEVGDDARVPTNKAGTRIDLAGMTVMAGFIDDHRHIVQGPGPSPVGPANVVNLDDFFAHDAADAMRDLLEAGFTTVEAGGDDPVSIMKLKRMVDSGRIEGPRLFTCAPVPTVRFASEVEVRVAIDRAQQMGANSICENVYPQIPWPFHPPETENKDFAAGVGEAKKLGMLFQVHAVSPPAMLEAVRMGATRFVHSTHYDWMTPEQAREIAASGAIVASSTNVPGAVFNVFSQDNQPHYRSGRHWPEGDAGGEAEGRSAAFMPLNLRTLYDNGVKIAYSGDAFPYTTHTPYKQRQVLEQELKTLSLVFSPTDIIKIMGQNSADFLNAGSDRGTLEQGKLADMVVLRGDPLQGYWNLLGPVLVIKGGEIVVDKRERTRSGHSPASATSARPH